MEAKDKAKELVQIYVSEVSDANPLNDILVSAKRCALICVDEIMYSYPTDPHKTLQPTDIKPIVYWRKVKKEIIKL